MSRTTWVAAALGAAVVATLTAAPARAVAPPSPVDCPTALPTVEAVDGVTGTGWTVERGTTPQPFTAEVIGRLTNGIAPGVDMIMARLDSPALQRAGGVWAGMSGSPVYAGDGRLIGSVSYGLSASSPIAGITPAESLQTLLSADPDDAAARSTRRVPVTVGVARRLARAGDVTAAVAQQGFAQLRTPIVVSGASGKGAQTLAQRLQAKTGVPVVLGGTSSPTALAAPALAGGDNFAVAAAYGDATLGGVGTATYTCAGQVVAFGHPFLDAGASTYSAHEASAVYVQPDAVNGPFKVANFGAVIGTVDRDRTLGLRGVLGQPPTTIPVVSRLTRVEGGAKRTGTTAVAAADLAPDAAAFHALYNVDRVMGSAATKGTAKVTLTVTGRRAGGAAFRLSVGDTFTALSASDPVDVQVADWVYSTVSALTEQPFERVTLTGITLDGTVSSKASMWRAPSIRYWHNGAWAAVPRRGIIGNVGRILGTRTRLQAYRDAATTVDVRRSLKIPASARRSEVEVVVTGGFDPFGVSGDVSEPTSFSGLLAQLKAARRTDQLTLSFVDLATDRVLATGTVRTTRSVEPFTRSFLMTVR